MKTTILTPEQFARYEAIASEYDRFRRLSQEEKEDLIIRIATSTYIDLLCDWAFKHDTDKLIYTYQLRETTGERYTKRSLLNLYLCELPRFAAESGKAGDPVEVWFDILQNMSNFASRPERYSEKYDPIFESSLQSPIPDQDKLHYFRSMFNDDVRSYLTVEDRKEIAEEFYAKGMEQGIEQGIEQVAKRMKAEGIPVQTIVLYTGLSLEAIDAIV